MPVIHIQDTHLLYSIIFLTLFALSLVFFITFLSFKFFISNFYSFLLSQVMQADAVVLLGEGDMDLPPTWVRSGAAVIRCEPTLDTGIVEYIVIVVAITLHGLEL